MTESRLAVDVCVVGGGPAGMVLGLLLARSGVRTLVIERHRNFDREYRGEVLMPRFTQMMRQIRLFDLLEKYPHLKLNHFEFIFRNRPFARVPISEISPEIPFALWMPQPVLLNALYDKARSFGNFDLWFGASAHELIEEGNQVVGVRVEREGKLLEVRARITVGTDGRASTVRRLGGFREEDEEYNFDIMWFTIPRPAEYEQTVRFFLAPGSDRKNYIILPKYPDLLQCGLIVPKGELLRYKERGIESLREELMKDYAIIHSFAGSLKDFGSFNVLQARVSFVKRWARNGCVLVGDSAHTCSPAGAIGVSVAVGSAIVAADVLIRALKAGDVSANFLDQIQQIRGPEVKAIQKIQKFFTGVLINPWSPMRWLIPLGFRFFMKSPVFRRLQRKMMVMEAPLPVSPDLHV